MLARIRRLLGLTRRAESVNLPAEAAPEPAEGHNHLFISDLHLGEACKNHSRIEYLKKSAELDAHVCRFLEWHTHNRPGERPWRLVLGGDFLDFLQVTIVPAGSNAEDRRFGLGTREDESVWKLQRLIERHRQVFVFLSGFVGAGNFLEVVQGNHDEELFWPGVRVALVESLVAIYFGGEAHLEEDPDAFAARIHFNPWFYLQPGLVYVEHGHRFDEYCATPPQLCPLRPQAETELTQPISGLAIRYFANLDRGFKTHDKEHWGLRDYFRYYQQQGFGRVFEVASRYAGLVSRAVSYHLEHGRFSSELAESEHSARRAEAAAAGALTDAQLQQLEALGARSVLSSPLGVYVALGMAEWTGIVAFSAMFALTVVTAWGLVTDILLLAGVTAAAVGWGRWARARFPTDIRRKLDDAAAAISKAVEVPVVVMGHSHAPVRRRLAHDHRCFFINTGSFLHTEQPTHGQGDRCNCATTFATLEHPDRYARPSPRLQRWCCVRGQPEPHDR